MNCKNLSQFQIIIICNPDNQMVVKGGRVGTARTVERPMSLVEAGSSIFYKMEQFTFFMKYFIWFRFPFVF